MLLSLIVIVGLVTVTMAGTGPGTVTGAAAGACQAGTGTEDSNGIMFFALGFAAASLRTVTVPVTRRRSDHPVTARAALRGPRRPHPRVKFNPGRDSGLTNSVRFRFRTGPPGPGPLK